MATKTKEAAMKAARKALGSTAAEGVDYQLRNTGAGWVHEPIPPANEPAKQARARKRANPPAPAPADLKANRATNKRTAASTGKAAAKPQPAKRAPRRKLAAAPKPQGEKPAEAKGTKTELVMKMISRPQGATSKDIEEATSWAPHSVRGLLGTFRASGVKVVSTKEKGQPTVYRVNAAEVGDVI